MSSVENLKFLIIAAKSTLFPWYNAAFGRSKQADIDKLAGKKYNLFLFQGQVTQL